MAVGVAASVYDGELGVVVVVVVVVDVADEPGTKDIAGMDTKLDRESCTSLVCFSTRTAEFVQAVVATAVVAAEKTWS